MSVRITITPPVPRDTTEGRMPVTLTTRRGIDPVPPLNECEPLTFEAPINRATNPDSYTAVDLVLAACALVAEPPNDDCQIAAEFARGTLYLLAGCDELEQWALAEGVGRHVTRTARRVYLPGQTADGGKP